MDGTDGDVWTAPGWGRALLGFGLAAALLIGSGTGQAAWAQGRTPPPDSQQMRPPGIERVQQRILEIRQAPTRWRQRLGAQLSGGSPAPSASARAEQSPRLALPEQRDGPSRADLRRVERRLQALIRELLADRYDGQIPARVAERFRFVPAGPVFPDTVRVATSVRDTITVTDTVRTAPDTVRTVPDTVRQTRVEVVEQQLLDTGVFRGFEVNFAFGESTLQPRATRTLDAVGEVAQRYPDLRLEIGGHTDAVGSDAFNQRLSEARAEAARTYLIDRFDLAPNRLVARGYGESQPVASNEERSGRALNRRVEFRVLNPEVMPE